MGEKKQLTPEEVITLQKENTKLANELNASNQANAKHLMLIEELNDQLAKKESGAEEISRLKSELLTKDSLIKELNDELADMEKTNDELGKYPVVPHKGKKYELLDAKSRARFEGKNVIINKESLEANPKLMEFCIKKGFACIRLKGGK